jgi:cell wall-associated NlpC family hydrolase
VNPVALALILGIPVGLLASYLRERGYSSADADMRDVTGSTGYLQDGAAVLADAIGWPYWYGQGSPATPWADGKNGVDCSGFAQMALVRMGLLASSAPDRGARSLADDSDPVAIGEQRPGDLAYYPGHVVVVVSRPGADGHSAILSASGHAYDLGNNPDARVKLYSTAAYRSDFSTYMRLRA